MISSQLFDCNFFSLLGGVIMRNIKISALLKAVMLLVLFLFMGCPSSAGGGNPVNNAISQDDIKGDGPAHEKLKNTTWQSKPNATGMSEVKLQFAEASNTCKIELPLAKKFYVAEYEVKDDKVNLKLDKNIEFFKNYTISNFLKGEANEMDEFMADMEKEMNDPNMPAEQKEALKKQLGIFKNAIKDGAFTSQEKFKKFAIEIMMPYMIKMIEAQLQDTSIPADIRAELETYLAQMKAMLQNPSLFDAYLTSSIEETKKIATHLSTINPIVLTIPQGQTLETSTTMTASKIYLGVDKSNNPQYKDNMEFTK